MKRARFVGHGIHQSAGAAYLSVCAETHIPDIYIRRCITVRANFSRLTFSPAIPFLQPRRHEDSKEGGERDCKDNKTRASC